MQKSFIIKLFFVLNFIILPIHAKKKHKPTFIEQILATKSKKQVKALLDKSSKTNLIKSYKSLRKKLYETELAIAKASKKHREGMEQICQQLPSRKEIKAFDRLLKTKDKIIWTVIQIKKRVPSLQYCLKKYRPEMCSGDMKAH